ncbi:thiopeptide-type bacteriocin biosynthesis protein [Cloacibacterium sp. TD35]|uniref:thiopeptide-type bacteriocin biosynthesis protein n=1 Tax=Cloacibacterium sp. TD35 TaxID=2976818 RepID=UPI00237D5E37|nr:thiopeptide-type bacteriocin biosynthesis protein [Cloacibacterium sp. TD35]WDT67973.1 thiopeptide-type bacteriocin biosynthesis protein [Cloacibacterium sp. TD35]
MSESRIFYPGSEWIYFKIYTGVKTSDIFLLEVIKPLVEQLQNEKVIKKWFFIRYNDPKPHLRIRFNISNLNNYNYILEKINSLFGEYLNSGEISNVIIDTYKRELERYGENTIEYAEELFFRSSELILKFLEYNDEEKIIVALFYIDCILSELGLSSEEKTNWIKNYDNSFKIEFNSDKSLNKQLKKKYQDFQPKYLEFIQSNEFNGIRKLITNNISEIHIIIEKILELDKKEYLNVEMIDFFQSIFHMHVNRLFISEQRLFEMIIYDYLLRLYKIYNINLLR